MIFWYEQFIRCWWAFEISSWNESMQLCGRRNFNIICVLYSTVYAIYVWTCTNSSAVNQSGIRKTSKMRAAIFVTNLNELIWKMKNIALKKKLWSFWLTHNRFALYSHANLLFYHWNGRFWIMAIRVILCGLCVFMCAR